MGDCAVSNRRSWDGAPEPLSRELEIEGSDRHRINADAWNAHGLDPHVEGDELPRGEVRS